MQAYTFVLVFLPKKNKLQENGQFSKTACQKDRQKAKEIRPTNWRNSNVC